MEAVTKFHDKRDILWVGGAGHRPSPVARPRLPASDAPEIAHAMIRGMPRRSPSTPDPAHAFDHEAGATLTIVQQLEHERLGTIDYVWPRFWPTYLQASRDARDRLGVLHLDVDRVEPHERLGTRHVPDDIRDEVLTTMTTMVLSALLTIRYFVIEVEGTIQQTVSDRPGDDLDRLRSICVAAGISDPGDRPGWSLVGELVDTRNRIEHPDQSTVYSTTAWDRVPLAWGLTDRALDAFDAFDENFGSSATEWETRKSAYANAGTFDLIARGLRSRRQPKKPAPE